MLLLGLHVKRPTGSTTPSHMVKNHTNHKKVVRASSKRGRNPQNMSQNPKSTLICVEHTVYMTIIRVIPKLELIKY